MDKPKFFMKMGKDVESIQAALQQQFIQHVDQSTRNILGIPAEMLGMDVSVESDQTAISVRKADVAFHARAAAGFIDDVIVLRQFTETPTPLSLEVLEHVRDTVTGAEFDVFDIMRRFSNPHLKKYQGMKGRARNPRLRQRLSMGNEWVLSVTLEFETFGTSAAQDMIDAVRMSQMASAAQIQQIVVHPTLAKQLEMGGINVSVVTSKYMPKDTAYVIDPSKIKFEPLKGI